MRFNNKKTGKYRSKLESTIRRGMPRRKDLKIAYESEYITYTQICYYNPDFVVTFPTGRKMYIEVKGYFRPEDRRKMASVVKCNPNLDIRMVFPKNNKRDERWCTKHNVKYAIGHTPKDWFDE